MANFHILDTSDSLSNQDSMIDKNLEPFGRRQQKRSPWLHAGHICQKRMPSDFLSEGVFVPKTGGGSEIQTHGDGATITDLKSVAVRIRVSIQVR